MLTIYAYYAPQISHYARETCHYASKLNHFFKSQTVGNDRPPSFSRQMQYALRLSTGPAPTLGGIFPRVFNVFTIARDLLKSCARSYAIRQATSTTTGLVVIESRGNCACAIRTGLKKITELCRHNARCFEVSIILEIMPA